ncbi:MAG TPA: FAD-binding protein, partial [Rhizobiales bacterium]|nr:FAD-binding protein [Hyphomicrobiales bacterium]
MTTGIIGGGIAGLSCALALARCGHKVEVFERAGAFREVGAGLQVGPNAMSALAELGLARRIAELAVSPPAIRIHDGLSGNLLSQLQLGPEFENRYGQPYRVIHRADLLRVLVEKAAETRNIQLNTSHELIALKQDGKTISATFANGATTSHDRLVAADGVHSVCRKLVFGGKGPVYAGHTLYRALCPIEDYSWLTHSDCVHLWLYPGGHIVHYPVSSGKQMNIVAAVEQ